MPDISRRELYRVVALALLILTLSSLPYALGYAVSSPSLTFDGSLLNTEDYHSYLSKMQQGARGDWRCRLLSTPEDHEGAYLQTFYIALGHLSTWTGLSLAQTYHLARLIFGLVLLLVSYLFIAFFLRRRAMRWVAYLLVCFSSGLGWLVHTIAPTQPGGISPLDFWFMDAYTFFTIFTVPHFCLAVTSLLLAFTWLLSYFRTYRVRYVVGAALSAVILGAVHPFTILAFAAVSAVYCLLLWCLRRQIPLRESLAVATAGLAPGPILVYYYHAFRTDPVLRGWQAQNFTPSPPPLYYVSGYGLVLFLAVLGSLHTIREVARVRGRPLAKAIGGALFSQTFHQKGERELFPLVWVITVAILSYLPLALQRRMIEGVHIPLCILAAVGLLRGVLPTIYRSRFLGRVTELLAYDRRRARLFMLNLLVAFTVPSNLYLLASTSLAVLQHNPALFHTGAENEAIDWLKDHGSWTDTVLSSYLIGGYITARIGHRVFWGHWDGTVDLADKRKMVEAFFEARTSDRARRAILEKYNVAYLFYGPQERRLGDFSPWSK
ncbi:MAG: hypothetical protein ACETWB_04165, partial [Anaerolineae bacterium]